MATEQLEALGCRARWRRRGPELAPPRGRTLAPPRTGERLSESGQGPISPRARLLTHNRIK